MRWIWMTLFIIFGAQYIWAQEPSNEAEIDSVLNELLAEDKDLYDLFDGNTNYHFLFFGTNFNSATFYNGNEIGDNQYNLSGQFYYFITNGLYFGVSGAWYSQSDPGFRTSIVTLGFTKSLPTWDFLRYRIAYDRYVYVNEEPDAQHDFNSDINLGISLRKGNVGMRLDYTLLMGDKYDNQLSADIFAKIKLLTLNKYDRIQFEPEISTSFVNEEIEEYWESGTMPFTTVVYDYSTEFGLVNCELTLPLSISYKDFDFEVAYKQNFPFFQSYFVKEDFSGFFKVSLGYIISIK